MMVWIFKVLLCQLVNLRTPDVVNFAEETLADIAAVVIPAIVHESKMQQCLPFMR